MRLSHKIARTAPNLAALKNHLRDMLLLFSNKTDGLAALRALLADIERQEARD